MQLDGLRDLVNQLVDYVEVDAKKSKRQKRDVLSILSLGLGLYNRMDLSSVHSSLRKLSDNQMTVSNNVKIVDHEVRINARAINASITAIGELFNQNVLIQDELKSMKVELSLREDVSKLEDIMAMVETAKRHNRWRSCLLDNRIIHHVESSLQRIQEQGYQAIRSALVEMPVSLISIPGGFEILFQTVIFKEAWTLHLHLPMADKLMDLSQTRMAISESGIKWVTMTEVMWLSCQKLPKIAFCPDVNQHFEDLESCLPALWHKNLSKAKKYCAVRPPLARGWAVEAVRGADAFLTVEEERKLTLSCSNRTWIQNLETSGYHIHLFEGCKAQLESWMWTRPTAVMEDMPLKLRPALSPWGDLELNRSLTSLKTLQLVRPMPLSRLATIEKVNTEFTIGWEWILVIVIVSLAVIALAVAYVVWRFKSVKVGTSAGVGHDVGGDHLGLRQFEEKFKNLV